MLDAKRKGVGVETMKVEQEKFKICPKCKMRNPEKSIFCEGCGTKLENIQTNKCPSCNHQNPVDAKFCVNCGQSLKKPEQEIEDDKTDETKEESGTVPSDNIKEPVEDVGKKEIPTMKIPTSVPEHAIISKTGTKKTCPACNGKNLKNAKFCVVCGEKFEEKSTEKDKKPEQKKTPKKEFETPTDTQTKNKTETSDEDPVEKIKKAKELLDIGAITSEEFEEIKSKYLKLI